MSEYVDWMGNTIREGDIVLYTSSSCRTGMNLARVTRIDSVERTDYHQRTYTERRVSVKILRSSGYCWGSDEYATTLLERHGAFRSLTLFTGAVI